MICFFIACLSLSIYQRKWKSLSLFYIFYEIMLQTAHLNKIVQYNTCYLTKISQHVTPRTIEFSGFQILESKTAHAHSFYKIIYFILFLNKLASEVCSIAPVLKGLGDSQHSTEYYMDVGFSANLARFHYRYIIPLTLRVRRSALLIL